MTEAVRQPSSAAMAVLTALLEARTGQRIAPSRLWRIDTVLTPVMRERGYRTLDELVAHLMEGDVDNGLADAVVAALINQETSFFREPGVFDLVVEAVTAAEGSGRRARIWSAGCASGQEPLSLAMLFAERHGNGGPPPPEIIATDVCEAALARARSGRFNQFEIQRGLPIRRAMAWFTTTPAGDWIASPELLRMVQFRRLNLVHPGWPVGRFDVVLCRNVLLYLSAPLKEEVFARFAGVLRPGGVLVLGAGETVIGQTTLFAPSQRLRGFYELADHPAREAA